MEKHFVEIQNLESDEGLWRVTLPVTLPGYDEHPNKTSSHRFSFFVAVFHWMFISHTEQEQCSCFCAHILE
jgi:hypothetical protein